ncbi:type II secretion system protein [Candidatus Ichthyocystis hellenicum]|uniref:type II secretion system protein n=1 Tax=Candidatus Ichthyocystis hellenicum TaxID=1561003 RepID=UPI000A6A5682|nr:type II secretion system protein [Candidatus Ichthyocystis hellenicum]
MVNKRFGFTLVEAIITALILGIVASMVIAQKETASKRSKEHELRHSLEQIRQAIDNYRDAVNKKKIIQDVTLPPYPQSLTALVEGVKAANGKKTYFLRRIPRDPFSTDSLEKAEETWNTRSSTSPPGDFSEGNDIYDVSSKSEDIGLNGIPYKEW